MNAAAGTQTLAFLGSATDGDASGVVTLHYSDGSTGKYWLGLSDWTLSGGGRLRRHTATRWPPPRPTGTARDAPAASNRWSTDVFYAAVPVNPGKTLTSVTLPNGTSGGRSTSSRSARRPPR